MKILNNTVLSLIILFTISPISFAQKQQNEKTDATTVDYKIATQTMFSKERQEKSKRVNAHFTSGGEITELPEGVEPLPLISHWWVRLSALPTTQSSTVILGEVTDAEAYLTYDKTGIYSEFSVRVEEVFKDTSKIVSLNDLLSINRLGGSVRFASGRINKYSIYQQGIPQKGEHYTFFLNQTEGGDFFILAGYKLTNNQIFPLDGEDNNDPKSALPFAQYKGVEKSVFLQDLRTALDVIEVNKK